MSLLDEAIEVLRLDGERNCVRVQRQLDAGQPATAGTCWWDDAKERLRTALPVNACRWCRTRYVLQVFDAEKAAGVSSRGDAK